MGFVLILVYLYYEKMMAYLNILAVHWWHNQGFSLYNFIERIFKSLKVKLSKIK